MATIIRLSLTGRAEKLIQSLAEIGLSERDIIAKALWIVEQVLNERIALLNEAGKLLYEDQGRYISIDRVQIQSMLQLGDFERAEKGADQPASQAQAAGPSENQPPSGTVSTSGMQT